MVWQLKQRVKNRERWRSWLNVDDDDVSADLKHEMGQKPWCPVYLLDAIAFRPPCDSMETHTNWKL